MKCISLAAVLLLGAFPRDGSVVYDTDAFFDVDFIPEGTPITASWSLPIAMVGHFEWAIGTSPGGVEIQDYTDVGTSSTAIASAVAVAGSIYYISVRSIDDSIPTVIASGTSDGVTGIGPASVTAAPLAGAAPLQVQFAADLPGVVLYEWDFDIPASAPKTKPMAFSLVTPGVDYISGASGTTFFTYTVPGDYDATLTLTHVGGDIHTTVIPISVGPGTSTPTVLPDVFGGPAPLTVTLTAAVTSEVGAYFWDFDNDGVFDASSDSSPTIVHTFTELGTYFVTATIVSPSGAAAISSSVQITVGPPAAGSPPNVTLSPVSGGPFRTGDVVNFTGGGDAGATGNVVSFSWDFDGNGEIDLVTPTPVATWQYAEPGTFNARLTILDDENLSASSIQGVTVNLDPFFSRVWLVEPQKGLKVAGNFVTITAQAVPADSVTGVDFYYRPQGSGPLAFPDTSWIRINATPVLPPPTTEFGTHWDVTALPAGAPGFELLAVASFLFLPQATSLGNLVNVQVDPVAPDIEENSGSPFTKLKTQGVNPNATALVGISRDTTFQLQAGTTAGYDLMRIERRSENPHPVESNLQGLRFVPGHFRRKTFASGQKLKKPTKVSMYLNTGGSDILPDGTDLTAASFKVMRFNDATLRWEPLYGQTFNASQKLIKAFTASTGDVAIAVVSTRVSGSSSSSGGCGLFGIEALAAGLAAAALARLRRRRA